MATTQHYVWAGGHFVLLISAFKYMFSWLLMRHPSAGWYKAAFTGALVSYAIVCQKSLGTPQPSAGWVTRALADENVQYLILAGFWWTSRPIAFALIPFMIFSLFHALSFTRTTLMPQFLPQGPSATEGGPPTPHPLAKKLQVWVKANYDNAMRLVAYAEVLIFLRVFFGVFLFMNSVFTPILFIHFVRMRYFQSPFTKEIVNKIIGHLDAMVNKPDSPAAAKQVWSTLQSLVGRWVGATTPARPAQPAAGNR